jgi:hypothetical protein
MSTEFIYKLHEENTARTNKLLFYKDELVILQDRLEEIVRKNNQPEVLLLAERFQNQWKIQRNNIDELMHQVKENEQHLQAEINSNPVAVDHRKVEFNEKEREAVEAFEKVFNDLREEFNKFASKWM